MEEREGHGNVRRRDVLKALSFIPAAWMPPGKQHTQTPPLVFSCFGLERSLQTPGIGSAGIFHAMMRRKRPWRGRRMARAS